MIDDDENCFTVLVIIGYLYCIHFLLLKDIGKMVPIDPTIEVSRAGVKSISHG
jgi:hypothetical protein